MKRINKIRFILGFVVSTMLFFMVSKNVSAEKQTIYNSPYVSFTKDGFAWTTNAGDANWVWYSENTCVKTNIPSSIRALQMGEHFYKKDRTGEVPIGYWKVVWPNGQCIHVEHPTEYHGVSYTERHCRSFYYSGWWAYCADCGEPISKVNMYMSKAAAESIDYMQCGSAYYYLCPHCRNFEQGATVQHKCNAISANRYRIQYLSNFPHGATGRGSMDYSIHFYNNAASYEGNKVMPVTKLSKNIYSVLGYSFVGWNTKQDGSGTMYADEASILNLTAENWDGNYADEKATVRLYAQWNVSESELRIDPNGGSYGGKNTVVKIKRGAGTVYSIDSQNLVSPRGYVVSFETNGGAKIANITGTKSLQEWKLSPSGKGVYLDGKYTFPMESGCVDTLVAQYQSDEIILPNAVRQGYSFGGWYYDSGFTKPAGDRITPEANLTLYAQWVQLLLSSKENYTAFGGKGAVDLDWSYVTAKNAAYRVWQSEKGAAWNMIWDELSENTDKRTILTQGKCLGQKQLVVPQSGTYRLKLGGAQGGNYGSYIGGKGGTVEIDIRLQKGEILYYSVGGQDGTGGGGKGITYGNGGGCTTVSSNLKGLIAVAGGGGGASALGDGGSGGSENSLISSGQNGESGGAGGGAGYLGGKSGEVVYHRHSADQCGYHRHSGNTTSGGACYGKEIAHRHSDACPVSVIRYCGGADWNGNMGWCPNCGRDESGGCPNYYGGDTCVRIEVYNCNSASTYEMTCKLDEGYLCGKNETEIENAKPAYGGSNYVNRDVVLNSTGTIGTKAGNGILEITLLWENNLQSFELKAVYSPDKKAPDTIDITTVSYNPTEAGKFKVSWGKPEDVGTEYFHKVDAYSAGSGEKICTSNVTSDCLTSGVAGYYYIINQLAASEVTNRSSYTTNQWLELSQANYDRYLHIAAVDKAGNLGKTVHIPLRNSEIKWNVETEPLDIQSGDNVASTGEAGKWYVKCDGNTPFYLQHVARLKGSSNVNYQLNLVGFQEKTASDLWKETWLEVPFAQEVNYESSYTSDDIGYFVEGENILQRYPYCKVVRTENGRKITTVQGFIMTPMMHGKAVTVIPEAGATYRRSGSNLGNIQYGVAQDSKDIRYSAKGINEGNGIVLIGDGEGPVIAGLENMPNHEMMQQAEQKYVVNLSAWDNDSGIAEFYVIVQNKDNSLERRFDSGNGEIRLELTIEDPLFSGDYTVEAVAVDHVGNKTSVSSECTEFDLKAEIEKLREPKTSPFRKGESGVLHISVKGYPDVVEVILPEVFAEANGETTKIFDYTNQKIYEHTENIEFMIPLNIPSNQQYAIIVNAYKENRKLEERPVLCVLETGVSVLDEVRTRLR